MKHQILLDKISYQKKPSGQEIKKIQKRLVANPVTLELEAILQAAVKGYSFKPSLLKETTKKDFVSTSLLAIDIDNKGVIKQSLADIVNSFKQLEIYVAGAYTTFTHTQAWPRYRLLIQLDRPVTYLKEAEQLYQIIKVLCPFQDSAIHPGSLLFGGQEIVYCQPEAVTVIDTLYKKYYKKTAQRIDSQSLQVSGTLSAQSYNKKIGNKDCVDNSNSSEKLDLSRLKAGFFKNILQFNKKHLTFDTFQAAITYLQCLPLHELLGLNSLTSCFIHQDRHPSAGIFQYEDGTYHYHCFACGALMDIIDFVAEFEGYDKEKDFMQLSHYLLRLFHIRVIDNTWKQGVEAQFLMSKKHLKFIEQYQPTHPYTVRALLYCDAVYRLLADECLISLEYVPAKDSHGMPLTRASLRYIVKRTGLSFMQVRARLERLQQAGFVRQLSDEETQAACSYFGTHAKLLEEGYTINTYAVNYINDLTIGQAEMHLRHFKESGATVKATSAQQSKYIKENYATCVKSSKPKSIRNQQQEEILLAWAKRTLKTKNYFSKEALIRYGVKKGLSKENIEQCITYLTFSLQLKRAIGSNELIKKYGLPKTIIRKAVFLKK